jgi:hypothetical protein
MTNGITKSMIKNGYDKGIVCLVSVPDDGCLACQIGGYWFYFAKMEDEHMAPNEYKTKYTKDAIIDNILSTLYSFEYDDVFEDEYWYYYFYLKEYGCK